VLVGKFASAALIAVMAGGGGAENRSPEGGFDQLASYLALA
jgi:hypothetical protein